MRQKRYWKQGFMAVLLAAALCVTAPVQVQSYGAEAEMEESEVILNDWIDEEQGPGVARWVDEEGNVSDTPGLMEDEDVSENEQEDGPENSFGFTNPIQSEAETITDVPQEQAAAEKQQAAAVPPGEQTGSGRRIDPSKPMVALTFDDGPYGPVGNQIMDCMAQYGGKATFFLVGNRVPSYGAEVKRMVAEGHEVANHTYEHKYLTKLNAEQIQYQVNQCNDVIESVCGVRPVLMRLPGGLKNDTVTANVKMPMIMWNIDTRDWETKNTQKTIDAVVGKVHDGDVVLMHEIYKQSGDAAVQIIPKLVEQGFQLVTVSEMAQYRGGVSAGNSYSSFR